LQFDFVATGNGNARRWVPFERIRRLLRLVLNRNIVSTFASALMQEMRLLVHIYLPIGLVTLTRQETYTNREGDLRSDLMNVTRHVEKI
jgi:hypothetical protein